MDFRDLVASDEWKKVYDRLHEMWKFHFRNAAYETERDKHLQHIAKLKMIEEIMGMPLPGLEGEQAVQYRKKVNSDRDKFIEERLNDAG